MRPGHQASLNGNHPRVRGEEPYRWFQQRATVESPPRNHPRVRGEEPILRLALANLVGITPACAGKS